MGICHRGRSQRTGVPVRERWWFCVLCEFYLCPSISLSCHTALFPDVPPHVNECGRMRLSACGRLALRSAMRPGHQQPACRRTDWFRNRNLSEHFKWVYNETGRFGWRCAANVCRLECVVSGRRMCGICSSCELGKHMHMLFRIPVRTHYIQRRTAHTMCAHIVHIYVRALHCKVHSILGLSECRRKDHSEA